MKPVRDRRNMNKGIKECILYLRMAPAGSRWIFNFIPVQIKNFKTSRGYIVTHFATLPKIFRFSY
ncbi:hypothetical protein A9X61_04810 [Enterobacter asburiae]|nr:hypothetical protein A9X61_04810 [Enterobacter asburiae]